MTEAVNIKKLLATNPRYAARLDDRGYNVVRALRVGDWAEYPDQPGDVIVVLCGSRAGSQPWEENWGPQPDA